jgi:F-type H+-transporting ATPase subunit delta
MAERIEAAARVYAQALYEAASEAGRLAEVDRDMQAFTAHMAGDRTVLRALLNPQLPAEAKHRIANHALSSVDPLVKNAINVLIDNGRVALLHDIQFALADMAAVAGGVLDMEITSAVPLAPEQVKELEQRISGATGLQAQLSASVDPSIIGGLVLRARDVLLDASVKRELEDIRRALITTPLPVGSEA